VTTRNAVRQRIDPNDERGNSRGYYIGDVFVEDYLDTDWNNPQVGELNVDDFDDELFDDYDDVPEYLPEFINPIQQPQPPYLNQPGNNNNMIQGVNINNVDQDIDLDNIMNDDNDYNDWQQ
jgi:hypothetical protein